MHYSVVKPSKWAKNFTSGYMMKSFSLRESLFTGIAILCFFFLAFQAIFPDGPKTISSFTKGPKIDEQTLELQAKVYVGFSKYILGNSTLQKSTVTALSDTRSQLRAQFIRSLEESAKDEHFTPALRKQAVLALILESEPSAKKFLTLLQEHSEREPQDVQLDKIIQRVTDQKGGTISNEERELLKSRLGWWSGAVIQRATPVDEDQITEYQAAGVHAFYKFVIVALGFATVILVGVMTFIFLVILFMCGGTTIYGITTRLPAHFGIEIFALYLVAMSSMEYALPLLGIPPEIKAMLRANVIGIFALSLLVLWPLASGASFTSVRQSLGLTFGSAGRGVRDVLFAPTFYSVGMIFLFLVLVVYSAALSYFNINPSAGTHPIVPILTASPGTSVVLYIFFLAVLAAPFVEEIMFRGAFYYWLRSRLSVFPAVLICGLCFATVHPQGLIGIVPLTAIGMALCLIREWRGTLVPSMLVHAMVNGGTLLIVLALFAH